MMPTVEELLARGAFEVKDGNGVGFDSMDKELSNPAVEGDSSLAKAVEELESRQHDQQPASQHTEAAIEVREGNLEKVRKFKFDRQQEVTDYVPGRIMHMSQFLGLLRTLDPTFFYNDFFILGLRGLNYVKNGIVIPLTSVQEGAMIEWSQLRTDEHGIGTNERYRGWRTVLMNLIDKEVLTEEQVHRMFGKPIGPRAKRWFRRLWVIRNGACADCEQKLCICSAIGETSRADNYQRAG